MTVTVFTPAYNRAYCLPRLYNSLCSQTSSDFEWIIVDDCSTDNTKSLVEEWIDEGKISITYFMQPGNGGKHRAVNKGVSMARGELFFIVDSDDFLTSDAVEAIIAEWDSVVEKDKYAGLCFRKMAKKWQRNGKEMAKKWQRTWKSLGQTSLRTDAREQALTLLISGSALPTRRRFSQPKS